MCRRMLPRYDIDALDPLADIESEPGFVRLSLMTTEELQDERQAHEAEARAYLAELADEEEEMERRAAE